MCLCLVYWPNLSGFCLSTIISTLWTQTGWAIQACIYCVSCTVYQFDISLDDVFNLCSESVLLSKKNIVDLTPRQARRKV